MTAFIVARYSVKNPEKMEAYAAAAGPTVEAHGGTFMAMGQTHAALVGEDNSEAVAMVSFADVDAAKAWFNSAGYTACKPLREAAADMQFTLYQAE